MTKTGLRQFITGESKYMTTEALDLLEDSIEEAGRPQNIATNVVILTELLRGYRHAVQRGYDGN